MKSATLVLTCLAITLTFSPNASCQSKFKCDEEYRFITKDGYIHQGELVKNNGDSLSLINSEVITIALDNVESASKVKRHTGTAIAVGIAAGAIIGGIIGKEKSEDGFDLNVIGYGVLGELLGGALGLIIGPFITSHQELELEMLPLCPSASRDIIPVRLGLTYRF